MKIETEHLHYRSRLLNELATRKRKNPAYSLRGFARDLGVSPAALSQALNSKRNLSKANLLKVAERLLFTPAETGFALREARDDLGQCEDNRYTVLQDDVFQYMSDWHYFAILSLAKTGKAKSDPNWLSARFGITEIAARDAVERLLRLKLIELRRGQIVFDGKPLRTTHDIPSSAVRALQKGHLKLAEDSLDADPVNLRDMTSMTMPIKISQIPKAKEMIKAFRRKLARTLESDKGDEVYVLGVQFFPVTRSGAPKK